MAEEYLELSELQARLKEGIEDVFPSQVWVRAELASVQARANGHCYLELSQSDGSAVVAKARAVIWKSRYYPLASYFHEVTGSDLRPGMDVLMRVQVNYSEVFGLTLVVNEIEAGFTLGQAELERRRTVEALRAEGLLDAQKELALPVLPCRLAVISARDAAGYGDFCRHLEGNPEGFRFKVDLFEAAMQGDGAPESISLAISAVEAAGGYDALLILRGGGSVLDLACFDDYGLCRAIALCSIPVVTAIGHDRDYHVADMVSHQFVKTPTALADLFIEAFSEEDRRLCSLAERMRMAFGNRLSAMENRLTLLWSGIRLALTAKVGAREAELASLAARIAAADPRQVLSRGFSLVTDRKGVVVKSASSVMPGDGISVRFSDGNLRCSVQEVELHES